MIIALHLSAFLQGLFPLFGLFSLGRPSASLIAGCFVTLVVLIYGSVRLERWAWWGSLVLVGLLTISTVLSFSRHGFYDIILMLNLPSQEMVWIDNLAFLHDYHPVGLFAIPLLAALGLIIYSKRFFAGGGSVIQAKAE
jgi:hypothetical protein